MADTESPTEEEIIQKIRKTEELLRGRVDWSEENRRLHEDSVEALAEAGVFRMRVAARHGGYESGARAMVSVASALARVDGALAWTASVYWIPTWMAGLFPESVQREVFSTPDVRVCGTLSPTATAVPAEGGIVVNGRWGFISGALHSHWQEIIAVRTAPNREPEPVIALVPVSELTTIDDWHTSGLRGTGSVSTEARDLFVPSERVLPLGNVLNGLSAEPSDSMIHRNPLLPVACASSVGTAVGLAEAAMETFLSALPGRKITYTDYAHQAEAPLTHHQVARASNKVDQARFHAHRLASQVDAKASEGAPWSLEERARARADLGAACRLAGEAVDVLAEASGGSSVYLDRPIQRIARDIRALNLHALMHPDTNAELYGRVLCGQEPNTLYL
ncbi:acyl-CoA dehydrogenase family protein [Nocardiopsis sp. RV163]|uniref:acyl-CoA dehydrogenase family protein n=1 Tax=Nocardiopsis sp. RV163 TaxID=1661388 RepID=UPI00064BE397|nr:acyl-CoA dehydrogenase family protein [Nocardiopsis sp. RV163]